MVSDRLARYLDRALLRTPSLALDRVATYRLEIDVIATLKRIYTFTKRIARVSVPTDEPADMIGD